MAADDEDFSGSDWEEDDDDGLKQDIEALRRACQPTPATSSANDRLPYTAVNESDSDDDEEEEEDDLQLLRGIQNRFTTPGGCEEPPLTLKPLCVLPPAVGSSSNDDDSDDDFETIRAIHRRFAAYNDGGWKQGSEYLLHKPEQVGATIIDSEKETSNNLFVESTNSQEGFPDCVDTTETALHKPKSCAHDDVNVVGAQTYEIIEWSGSEAADDPRLPAKSSEFPKAALAFVDAIKKNRSCQKLIRSKLMQIEARIEEITKLKERVKVLKDFQVACSKRTGKALSQKKDACVQLISLPKLRGNSKFNDNKIPALYKGPPENLHVVNYKEALQNFPVSLTRQKWSKEEKENLAKGLKQQLQGMLLQQSVNLLSDTDGSSGDSANIDSIFSSIKELEITPENMRLFLPKVNWNQLASMYVPGRSGAECQARWLNCEDLLINHHPWTTMEDKNLLHIVQQKGLSNWIDVAMSLGTNRTPFQCLARYQRSLNASIIKREWTEEEDIQLRAAVERFGESNWQVVASMLQGRRGTQCSNRWLKTLHPGRKKVGKWSADEDKCLKVAVTLFGQKKWKKVAQYVPGRTHVQCRERWVNALDPSLNLSEWTEEEDSKLETAIAEHGYCWSKVAACIPPRTDSQCRRRWKVLFPHEVPLLQAARKIQRTALISNFVDRESERPTFQPGDFVPLPEMDCGTSKTINVTSRKRTRSRSREELSERDASSGDNCSEEVPRLANGNEVKNMHDSSIPRKKRDKRLHSTKGNDAICSTKRVWEECECSDPIEKSPPHVKDTNLLMMTMGKEVVELGWDYGPKIIMAPKVYSRRHVKHHEVVQEPLSPVDLLDRGTSTLKMRKEMNEKTKKGAYVANGSLSSFSNSVSVDTSKDQEARNANSGRKKKRKTRETCFRSELASSSGGGSVELSLSNLNGQTAKDGNEKLEEEVDDDAPLALFYNKLKKRKAGARRRKLS